jgi:hypothetical protein
MGSHILALRKSEPSLEDVFVELVGRGFDEEDGPEPPAVATGDRRADGTSTTDDEESAEVA